LAGSLPEHVVDGYRREREDIVRTAEQMNRALSAEEEARLEKLYSERIEAYLDAGHGECHLRKREIAEEVRGALMYFHGARYELLAWCVMPNHVHVLFTPLGGHGLGEIVHSWKSFTAKKANRLLGREGEFWMAEYYDRLVRDGEELAHHREYILKNPVKAGLGEWAWVGVM
jgi:REP element-mobilizing transposase RayT